MAFSSKGKLSSKGLFIFLYLLTLVTSCAQGVQVQLDCSDLTKNYWQIVEKYKSQNNINALLVLTQEIIKRNQHCRDAYALRGDIYFSLDSIEQAHKDYKFLTQIDSNNVYAWFEVGALYELKAKYDSAVYYYDKAIGKKKINDSLIIDRNNSFETLTNQRGYDVAYSKIVLRKGIASYYNGNLKAAFKDIQYCINEKYALQDAYFYRGLIYFYLKQSKDFCADFEKAKLYGNLDAENYIKKYCNK